MYLIMLQIIKTFVYSYPDANTVVKTKVKRNYTFAGESMTDKEDVTYTLKTEILFQKKWCIIIIINYMEISLPFILMMIKIMYIKCFRL